MEDGGDDAAQLGDLECQLSDARSAAQRRRRRVQVPCMVTGLSFLLATCILRCLLSIGCLSKNALAVVNFAGGLSATTLLLSVLPTQERHIRCAVLSLQVGLLATVAAGLPGDLRNFLDPSATVSGDLPLWHIRATAAIQLSSVLPGDLRCVLKLQYLLWAKDSPRRHLELVWRTLAETSFVYALRDVIWFFFLVAFGLGGPCVELGRLADGMAWVTIGSLCMCSRLRSRVQAMLAERGEQATAALVVGALLGSRPLHELMRLSKEHFRCVAMDRVTKDMVDNNAPNPELIALTERAELGGADAFISHSWHDDAEEKWEALQVWRAEFKAAMGREPKVWFDRFSIDQENIRDSLAGLPIYLAGCHSLLVLMGETYVTRLWCLMELFTFIVMGGKQAQLEIRTLPSCRRGFDSLDVLSATCSRDEDRSRLVGIIEAGLGSVERFSCQVSDLGSVWESLREAAAREHRRDLAYPPVAVPGGKEYSMKEQGETDESVLEEENESEPIEEEKRAEERETI